MAATLAPRGAFLAQSLLGRHPGQLGAAVRPHARGHAGRRPLQRRARPVRRSGRSSGSHGGSPSRRPSSDRGATATLAKLVPTALQTRPRRAAAPRRPRAGAAASANLRLTFLALLCVSLFVLLLHAAVVPAGRSPATGSSRRAEGQAIREIPIAAPRGDILDRDGEVLVGPATPRSSRCGPTRWATRRAGARARRPRRPARPHGPSSQDRIDTRAAARSASRSRSTCPRDIVFYLHENASTRFPGVYVERLPLRDYPHGTLAAHVARLHRRDLGAEQLEDRRVRTATSPATSSAGPGWSRATRTACVASTARATSRRRARRGASARSTEIAPRRRRRTCRPRSTSRPSSSSRMRCRRASASPRHVRRRRGRVGRGGHVRRAGGGRGRARPRHRRDRRDGSYPDVPPGGVRRRRQPGLLGLPPGRRTTTTR